MVRVMTVERPTHSSRIRRLDAPEAHGTYHGQSSFSYRDQSFSLEPATRIACPPLRQSGNVSTAFDSAAGRKDSLLVMNRDGESHPEVRADDDGGE